MEATLEEFDFLKADWDEYGVPDWDDPVWYTETGELVPLNHLWYPTSRVTEVVLARLSEQDVHNLAKRHGHTRQWNRIRKETQYCHAEFVDRFFVNLGMPSFHTVLGAPELACKHAPRDESLASHPAPNAKFTMEQRLEIRRRRVAGERTCDLAAEYGVSTRSIVRACSGGSYRR